MKPLTALAVVLATGVAAGCLDAPAMELDLVQETEKQAPAQTPFLLEWEGYHRLGALDQFGHQRETEPLVENWEKVGTRLSIPSDVAALEFNLTWEGEEDLHLMIHAPMREDASMPSYMGMGGENVICVRVPVQDLEGGTWEAMTHPSSSGPMDVDFTIRIWGIASGPGEVLPGYHGHPIAEDWTMPMRQHDRCLAELDASG